MQRTGYLFARLSQLVRRGRSSRDAARSQTPAWGRPVERDRDFENIGLYHRAKLARDGGESVDDRTWADLDLDAVFAKLDRCASGVGQQVLYRRLRTPLFEEQPLRDLDALVEALSADPARREGLCRAFGKLDSPNALLLPYLFLTPLPALRRRAVYPALTAAALSLLVGSLFVHALVVPLGAVFLLNAVLHLLHRRRLSNWIAPLSLLNRLIGTGLEVVRAPPVELSRWFPGFAEDARALAPLRRKSAWLIWNAGGEDDVGSLARQYVNAFFLLEVNALTASLADLRTHAGRIERVFEALGTLDAAISIGSVRAGEKVTRPVFTTDVRNRVELEDAVHPLVENPVPNSLVLDRGLILTGSNMSGKSTLLRTVGINALLAQTIFTTFTASYRAPFLKVESAIGISDSLTEGKSYFLAELERIRGFFAPHPLGVARLFLLDELFRGTNAVERIAAGCAVLRQLNRGHDRVLVATHDLELVSLLGDTFRPFHFRELIEDGALRFDYRLQPGPSSTRNAIALLEVLRFPPEVVADAFEVVAELEGTSASRRAPMSQTR